MTRPQKPLKGKLSLAVCSGIRSPNFTSSQRGAIFICRASTEYASASSLNHHWPACVEEVADIKLHLGLVERHGYLSMIIPRKPWYDRRLGPKFYSLISHPCVLEVSLPVAHTCIDNYTRFSTMLAMQAIGNHPGPLAPEFRTSSKDPPYTP
ncbi:hypothetical protein TEQG_00780 [Trichophyton equinum CBS 127.97]|uniref:Uncharacterized protein n=1 Tax=Trichophyton equinum (strain ATCC MYA-4606 / CBS 127.97) TaxID=559882 RepID=F2PIH4_TRIEC|nr:hypothetical protein TEQG_00780 [Trichophyton equinum CBS 127.97]